MEKLGKHPIEEAVNVSRDVVKTVGSIAFNAFTYAVHQMQGGAWGELGKGLEPQITEEQIKQAEEL